MRIGGGNARVPLGSDITTRQTHSVAVVRKIRGASHTLKTEPKSNQTLLGNDLMPSGSVSPTTITARNGGGGGGDDERATASFAEETEAATAPPREEEGSVFPSQDRVPSPSDSSAAPASAVGASFAATVTVAPSSSASASSAAAAARSRAACAAASRRARHECVSTRPAVS